MKPFNSTDKTTQDVIKRRYKVTNPNNTFVDSKARPFEKIGGGFVSCTLKRSSIVDAFHKHELKCNKT